MLLVLVPALLLTGGCQTISYYSHAALGQWRVLASREPVAAVLSDLEARRREDPDARLLYERLSFSQEVLDFAEHALFLPVGQRYRTYVDLGRPSVVWNLFATPPLSLEPYRWCYPVVGCAPYRGYFDADFAGRRAARFETDGYETYVGGVAAYSTLGWFADPLLSSFVTWPEPDLAALLFHELAHGRVWVAGDVAFNESFATFVGRQGLSAWLRHRGDDSTLSYRQDALRARHRVLVLLEQTREMLRKIYASPVSDAIKLERKARVLAGAEQCYRVHRERFGAGRFDTLMTGLNNARLASVATYEDLVPAFTDMFQSVHGDWRQFYDRVEALAELEPAARGAELLRHQQVAERGDDERAHNVECQSLAGHFLDGESAG